MSILKDLDDRQAEESFTGPVVEEINCRKSAPKRLRLQPQPPSDPTRGPETGRSRRWFVGGPWETSISMIKE